MHIIIFIYHYYIIWSGQLSEDERDEEPNIFNPADFDVVIDISEPSEPSEPTEEAQENIDRLLDVRTGVRDNQMKQAEVMLTRNKKNMAEVFVGITLLCQYQTLTKGLVIQVT